jgi:MFS family permease
MSARGQTSAFAIRDFRLLTQARFLFGISVQIQAVVIGWQIYEIKHDPLYLGLTGLVEAAPALSLALFAGEFVDRNNPLRIYRNVILLSLVSALILLFTASPFFPAADGQKILWLYLAAFITGSARGFSGPALYALIPQLVHREVLKVSSAWLSAAFQFASIGGPAIGGLLYSWRGPTLPYLIESLGLFSALVLLRGIAHRPRPAPKDGLAAEKASRIQNIASGVKFVFGHQLLLSALALDMFAVLFGGVTAILPVFAAEILHIGPTGLGVLRAAPALGALFMSIYLIRHPIRGQVGRLLLSVIAGFGLCIISFGISRHYWLSLSLLVLSGALDSVSMVIRGTIVQLSSPEDMRGRIASVNSVFISSSNEIGAFESGVAAKLLGTVPSVIFGGTMTLLTVAATTLLAPKLRRMKIEEL